jgi:putative acyl-CoA dehydrogenase
VHGGSGVMEDSPMPRLFRESPANAIWEGSGNIQCLDVLRATHKTPAVVQALFAELAQARGGDSRLDAWVASLQHELRDLADLEFRARALVDRMALAIQATLLVRHAPPAVVDAFCASRLGGDGYRNYGTLPSGTDCSSITDRATPARG